ncbi:hypothetical protein L1787_15220 [Acuticoccus sp. M5D2P5]|uniref:hypothetical protein n=1 Tax=Acuticoccus kalidii TaxID=2910977 RepID=UPI001F30141A|nr:hypothetical protein [Acuticoccus kalidii]MCF3934752.1 hypothetical protein [Acuticoccus kalidii]
MNDVDATATAKPATTRSFWLRESPHLAALALTVGGVAYVSMMDQPLLYYWDVVAVFIAVVCVISGWPRANQSQLRTRLVVTQLLHWAAFLLAMNLVFLPSVQSDIDADGTGLVLLLLLSLGTFVAGVHVPSWRMAAIGVIMALSVPAIAWLDQSALLLSLLVIVIGAAVIAMMRYRRRSDTAAADI